MTGENGTADWRELSKVCLHLAFEGQTAEAIHCGTEALELAAEDVGRDHADFAECLKNLACAYLYGGDPGEAETMLREAVAIGTATLGAGHELVAEYVHQLGAACHLNGKLDEAEKHYRSGLAIRENLVGASHPTVAKSLGDLARLLHDRGRPLSEVEAPIRRAQTVLGDFIARAAADGASAEPAEPAEADQVAEAVIDLSTLCNNLGYLYLQNDRPVEAETELLKALDYLEEFAARGGRPGDRTIINHMTNLRNAIAAQGRDVGEHSAFVTELLPRAEALLEPTLDDLVAQERLFWAALTAQLLIVRDREKLTDAAMADALYDVFSTGHLPSMFFDPPELPDLLTGVADRAFQSELITIVPMTLELVSRGVHPLEESLETLAEIAIGILINTDPQANPNLGLDDPNDDDTADTNGAGDDDDDTAG